ncbi:LuxR C-terminal-related transcriptional regulator [Lentzea sp. NPDC003310]|uniref:LuxR C-terminal-related transcriptional regulator n=1 Tax=Lentzea sp. NPDC003310 TaxID=3154447 RepID=UPI00339E3C3C
MGGWAADPGHECPAALASGLLAAGESWTEAVEAAERALASPVCRENPWCVSWALVTLVCAGELVAADEHSLALLESHPGDHVLLARACLARCTGDLVTCSALLDLVRHNGTVEIRSAVLYWTVELLVARDELDAAGAVLLDDGLTGPLLLAAEAVVAMAAGRPRDALAGHLACGEALTASGVLNPAVLPWRSSASRAALACGDTEQALRLALEEHTAAARWGEPRALGRCLAAVAGASPPHGEDLLIYERAIRLLDMAHARWELAEVLCDYGDRLTAHRKQAAAGEMYARAAAVEIGDTVLRRRIDAATSGAAAREPVLTPVEAEVARLVCAGLNNREIAARLAMATRTVELHLTRVYRKLGLAGRRELRATRWAWLHRETLRTDREATGGGRG